MFEDCGFEIYETMTKVYTERELADDSGSAPRRRLECRDALAALQESFYRMEEAVRGWEPEEADKAMKR